MLALLVAILAASCGSQERPPGTPIEATTSPAASGGVAPSTDQRVLVATLTPTTEPEASASAIGPGGAGLLESLPLAPDATFGVTGSPNLGGVSFLGYGAIYFGAEGEQARDQFEEEGGELRSRHNR